MEDIAAAIVAVGFGWLAEQVNSASNIARLIKWLAYIVIALLAILKVLL